MRPGVEFPESHAPVSPRNFFIELPDATAESVMQLGACKCPIAGATPEKREGDQMKIITRENVDAAICEGKTASGQEAGDGVMLGS